MKLEFVDTTAKLENEPTKKLHVSVVQHSEEVEIQVTDGVHTAAVLGIRAKDGTVVRYTGQSKQLDALGLAMDAKGYIKMFN